MISMHPSRVRHDNPSKFASISCRVSYEKYLRVATTDSANGVRRRRRALKRRLVQAWAAACTVLIEALKRGSGKAALFKYPFLVIQLRSCFFFLPTILIMIVFLPESL
ncbi:hypothetical protein F5888DRAFT_1724232 [Russula emetica]|nr:hypothetical protein F5888DRAFT_1724232 [Russula emetica]